MKIILNLSRHCIKCAASRAHEARLYAYFKASPEKQSELLSELEALRAFLERTDFQEIRSRYPVLAGEIDKDVILEANENGGFELVFDGVRIRADVNLRFPPTRVGNTRGLLVYKAGK